MAETGLMPTDAFVFTLPPALAAQAGVLPGALDHLPGLASSGGEVLDLLDHWLGEHRHLFVQYANGLQLDLLAMPASARKGYVAGEVVLYDADAALGDEVVPRAFQYTGATVRE